MIKYIEKRDGNIAKFNPKNIYNAVYQSAKSCNEFIDVDNVVRLVTERLEKRNQPTINIEIVQDEVEFVLMGLGYFKAAKSYITYRNMRDAQRNLSLGNINAESSVEEYLSRADWRVNANANQGYSLGGMILNVAGKVTANYWLNKIYPKEVGQAHRNGDIHIHDLDMLSIYCCGWSLKNVLREGMNGIAGKIESNPPKHLSSALNQALNHLCCCFTGDTKIWKADGSTITFQECLDQDIKELDVLSFNEKTGKVVKSHMTDIGVYKEVDELIELTFAFGDSIKCTPDHKFLTNSGWVEAKDLKFGTAIFTQIDGLKVCVRSTKHIKLDKKVPVFCGNVDTYHNFFTGDFGIASHNCQNEAAGAQAYSSFDTYMAPYIRLDNLSYKEVKQHLQEFIYNLNVPSRWGTQTPFTNLTFDWVCPEDLKKEKPIVGGKECNFFYGDLQKEMDMINKAYIEIMLEGDKNGRVFTFPIPTYNMTKEFDWDSENSTLLFEMTAKYGLPYFQNFINSELKPNMIRSMCCRLQLDLRELLKRGNGLFGSAEQTGSVGVVTINCARLGYLFKGDKESLYNRLDYLMDLARNSLELKRKTLKQNMDRGLYPYIKRWLGTLRNHFSTIGVNGINEMIRNFTNDKEDITTEKGHAFAVEFLDHVRAKLLSYQSEQGTMYNLEATPAEGTTYRFAKEDKKRFPDIIQAGTPSNPYYTNSSQLPVGYTDDPFEALEMQDDLQRKYTGGCCEEGTDVLTDKGIFKIEKLVEDFEKLKPIKVISFNEKTKVSEWKEIDEVYKIDVSFKDKIRVKGENNFEIVTSDWHPFFVSTKKKLASNVCPVCGETFDNYQGRNNHLAHNPKCREKYHSIKEKVFKERPIIQKRADELVVMDRLIQNSTNLLSSQTPVSKELAYILGFFIGNGYLASTTYRLSFYSGKKDNPLDYLCECLKKEFGIIETPEVWEPTNPNCIEVRITGKERILSLRKLFAKFGFKPGKKTYTISANPVIPYLDKNNFPCFLSGLLDSDGYIDQQGDGEYATVSASLYDSLVYLFTMAGINLRIKYHKSKKANEKDFYSLYLKKKYLMKYFDELSPTLQRALILGILKEPKKERQQEVVRVKEVSKTQVSNNQFYDLNIRDNHNYLAGKNGSFVFVHNTVLHLYMNEAISSSDACKKIVKRALTNFKLPYITITPTFSICPIHGYIKGQHEYCPKCDAELLAKKANK